jgi:glycerol-3-phosphate acyltransferase PlsY
MNTALPPAIDAGPLSAGVYALLLAGAFLAGSVPFALLVGLARGIDIRQHGSRNVGATNAVRVLGKPLGVLAFALDALKGAVPVVIAGALLGTMGKGAAQAGAGVALLWLGVAVAAVLGHMFSPWVGFKGGKGVATGFGALGAMWPPVLPAAIAGIVLWYVVMRLSRYVSVASIAAAALLPALVALTPMTFRALGAGWATWTVWPYVLVTGVLGALVIVRHRANIARLRAGTENRVGAKPAPAGGAAP